MGFRNNCYATVWADKDGKVVDCKDKYAEILLSTSHKKKDGGYETDFRRKVRFIGKAFETIKSVKLAEKDRLHLLEVEVTVIWQKEAKREYSSFLCYDCEIVGTNAKPQKTEIIDSRLEEVSEDDLPF